MPDAATISSLATAGGTLVLAVATFSSVRSANRSARVAELSLLTGLRPVLIPSRESDPAERIRFGDEQILHLNGHGGEIAVTPKAVYLAMGLRNGGSGLAVIHGWRVKPRPVFADDTQVRRAAIAERPPLDQFQRQQIDLFIPAGETGYWLGALRDPSEPIYDIVSKAANSDDGLQIDLLYGDVEGGQRTIVRFIMSEWPEDDVQGKRVTALRYWNLDRSDPR